MEITLSELNNRFNALQKGEIKNGIRNHHLDTLIEGKLHILKNSKNCFVIWLELDSNEDLSDASKYAYVQVREVEIHETQKTQEIKVLEIASPKNETNYLLVHICERIHMFINEGKKSKKVLKNEPIKKMIKLLRDFQEWSIFKNVGLIGELIFLKYLLDWCNDKDINNTFVLGGWKGGQRDFRYFNTAVEVKTTTGSERQHATTLSQLEPQDGEKVFVCSVHLKEDPGGRHNLWSLIQDVEIYFSADGIQQFRKHILDDYHLDLEDENHKKIARIYVDKRYKYRIEKDMHTR